MAAPPASRGVLKKPGWFICSNPVCLGKPCSQNATRKTEYYCQAHSPPLAVPLPKAIIRKEVQRFFAHLRDNIIERWTALRQPRGTYGDVQLVPLPPRDSDEYYFPCKDGFMDYYLQEIPGGWNQAHIKEVGRLAQDLWHPSVFRVEHGQPGLPDPVSLHVLIAACNQGGSESNEDYVMRRDGLLTGALPRPPEERPIETGRFRWIGPDGFDREMDFLFGRCVFCNLLERALVTDPRNTLVRLQEDLLKHGRSIRIRGEFIVGQFTDEHTTIGAEYVVYHLLKAVSFESVPWRVFAPDDFAEYFTKSFTQA